MTEHPIPLSLLDSLHFPWSRKDAQQLYDVVINLSPTIDSAVDVASRAGLRPGRLTLSKPVDYLWRDILNEAASQAVLRRLIQAVHDGLYSDHPQRAFLGDLLAGRPTSISGESLGTDGKSHFIAGTPLIETPESLLFHDDLTLPVGRMTALIEVLRRLQTLAPAVCRLTVEVGRSTMTGTGFRISREWLLTNAHVLYDGPQQPATAVTAEFGADDDGLGHLLSPTPIRTEVSSIVADHADDWAVIRMAEPLSDVWPVIGMAEVAEPVVGAEAFIIQHPMGGNKRVGFMRNAICNVDDRVVHYLTDTRIGSSGSPVFNALGQLIAVHHLGGTPQTVVGRPPMKKNEGIRATRIAAALRALGVTPLT
jgi:Trypsin-like peptidase domain/Effector-associated domain 1